MKILHQDVAWLGCAWVAALFVLLAGCAGTGSYERAARLGETDLRGVLEVTNAPGGVVAVLHSRSGTRMPCCLQAVDYRVADDLRTFAAKGSVVIVTGSPGPEIFTVTSVRESGKRRRVGAAEEEDGALGTPKDEAWPSISWGGVPGNDR
ncbi:MAG: hypothetical protein ACOYOU_09095 [Kiritimatiellia bacterium]